MHPSSAYCILPFSLMRRGPSLPISSSYLSQLWSSQVFFPLLSFAATAKLPPLLKKELQWFSMSSGDQEMWQGNLICVRKKLWIISTFIQSSKLRLGAFLYSFDIVSWSASHLDQQWSLFVVRWVIIHHLTSLFPFSVPIYKGTLQNSNSLFLVDNPPSW